MSVYPTWEKPFGDRLLAWSVSLLWNQTAAGTFLDHSLAGQEWEICKASMKIIR